MQQTTAIHYSFGLLLHAAWKRSTPKWQENTIRYLGHEMDGAAKAGETETKEDADAEDGEGLVDGAAQPCFADVFVCTFEVLGIRT